MTEQTIEYGLVRALLSGDIPPDLLEDYDLGDTGGMVLKTVKGMVDEGATPPFTMRLIQLGASKIFGADGEVVGKFLRKAEKAPGDKNLDKMIGVVRNRTVLTELVNEAGEQIRRGDLDSLKFHGILDRESKDRKLISIAETYKKAPRIPDGWPIHSIPKLHDIAGGLMGLWVIGGESGIGKSVLAMQLALEAAKHVDVLFEDVDGTGIDELSERIYKVAGNMSGFKKMTKRLYIKDSLTSLNSDLMVIKPPALIVFDSIQSIASGKKTKFETVNEWVDRAKQLRKKGYTVVMTSEVPRESYGTDKKGLAAFKTSGDIEYAASFAIRLYGDPMDYNEPVDLEILKNRHRKVTVREFQIERDGLREW